MENFQVYGKTFLHIDHSRTLDELIARAEVDRVDQSIRSDRFIETAVDSKPKLVRIERAGLVFPTRAFAGVHPEVMEKICMRNGWRQAGLREFFAYCERGMVELKGSTIRALAASSSVGGKILTANYFSERVLSLTPPKEIDWRQDNHALLVVSFEG